MTNAGAPALAAPATPPHRTARGADADAADPLDAFLAKAGRRRERHTRHETGRPEEWADPDPEAIRSPAGGHPVDRAANRHREGSSRNHFLGQVRVACERLQGLEPRTLSADDVRAYPWHQLDPDRAREFREDIYRRFRRQTTRNDQVSVVRRVMRQCYTAGLISALRLERVLEELYTVAPGPSSKRRRLSQSEINDLLAACERVGTPAAAARNTAIVALLRTSGIRIGELSQTLLEDWDRDAGTILLPQTKNGRAHLVYLHPDAVPYLERWLSHRGEAPGALFCPLTGADQRPLTTATLRWMIASRAAAAGVAPFGCHDFRRTFATELLRTHDVALVGKLLNHTKVQSTLCYDLAGEDDQRAAVAQLDLPPVHAAETDPHDAAEHGRAVA